MALAIPVERTVVTAVVLSRRIHPAAFALTLSCLAIGLSWVNIGKLDGPWDELVGYGALFTVGVLTSGWIIDSNVLLRLGLFISTILWCYVAYVAWVVFGGTPANWLGSLAWATLAGLTYYREQNDYAGVKRLLGG